MDEEQKAKIDKTKAEATKIYVDTSIVPFEALAGQGPDAGRWPALCENRTLDPLPQARSGPGAEIACATIDERIGANGKKPSEIVLSRAKRGSNTL
jgi:hypothetical protein